MAMAMAMNGGKEWLVADKSSLRRSGGRHVVGIAPLPLPQRTTWSHPPHYITITTLFRFGEYKMRSRRCRW